MISQIILVKKMMNNSLKKKEKNCNITHYRPNDNDELLTCTYIHWCNVQCRRWKGLLKILKKQTNIIKIYYNFNNKLEKL